MSTDRELKAEIRELVGRFYDDMRITDDAEQRGELKDILVEKILSASRPTEGERGEENIVSHYCDKCGFGLNIHKDKYLIRVEPCQTCLPPSNKAMTHPMNKEEVKLEAYEFLRKRWSVPSNKTIEECVSSVHIDGLIEIMMEFASRAPRPDAGEELRKKISDWLDEAEDRLEEGEHGKKALWNMGWNTACRAMRSLLSKQEGK